MCNLYICYYMQYGDSDNSLKTYEYIMNIR